MAQADSPASSASESSSRPGFLVNVFWNWIGVGVNLFTGFLLSPYLVRKLGEERYGIWALVFALIEYFTLLDLGFRSAVVNYTARYQAARDSRKINEVINAGLFYFACIAPFLMAAAAVMSWNVDRLFHISSADYRRQFAILLLLTGLSGILGMMFNVFRGALEGFQRFEVHNYIWIVVLVVRAAGLAVLLYLGYGLVELGIMVVVAQTAGYALTYVYLRRIFPPLRVSPAMLKWSMVKHMASYGIHSFLANASLLALNQSPPVLVAYFRPAAFVGFYTLPQKLLQYTVEAVSRAGLVTGSKAAELSERGSAAGLLTLAIYANRYCFTLFMPLNIFLLAYSRELILRWVGPSFAQYSTPLVLPFALSTSLALAGQFNSSAILFGMARHQKYARSVMVEAVVDVAGIILVMPHYGILGAAWVVSISMIVSRAIYTPWVACRQLGAGFWRYMSAIYLPGLLTAAPVALLALGLKARLIPGATWTELFAALALIGALYLGAAFFTCLTAEHRAVFTQLALSRLRRAWA